MIVKNSGNSDDDEEEVTRSRGKFSEFSNKMERIFRTAFKKASSQTQAKPKCDNEVDEPSTTEDSQILDNSDVSSRVKEVSEGNNLNNEKRPVTRKIRQLKRFEHVHSTELEPNSMDVVVEVHHAKTEKLKDPDDIEIPSEVLNAPVTVSLDNFVDSGKKQRKRWSKDAGAIKLPSRTSLSSSTSGKSNSRQSVNEENTVIPVPAPRFRRLMNSEEDSDAGVDNAAFQLDHDDEQILTIETESNVQDKKIEIKSVDDIEASDISTENLESQKIESLNSNNRFSSQIKSISQQSEDSGSLEESVGSLKNEIKEKNYEKLSKMRGSSDSYETEESDDSIRVMKSRRKSVEPIAAKRLRKKEKEHVTDDSSLSLDKLSNKNSKSVRKNENFMKFISVTIHKTDILEMDYITRHPMVIVHIVEANTGNYMKTNNEKSQSRYLQPLITGTFNFRDNKSMSPQWEEELIFEEDFNAILMGEKSKVLILFEIVDLLSFAEASHSYDQFGGDNCWYKIAWAFLKPIGSKEIYHINKQVRLQLYKPKRIMRMKTRHKCEVYNWWKSGNRDKYPSTLYVTVQQVDPPKLEPVFYGDLILNDITEDPQNLQKLKNEDLDSITAPKWGRLAAQSCKIPNTSFFMTEISENGCFYVLFSNNGMYLACANADEYDYPIVIYKVDEIDKIFIKFTGHKNFIYTLDWSVNDDYLLSVSSDQTACLWDIKNKLINYVFMLPHPSYVYCGRFNPSTDFKIIATGCYDNFVRIWSKSTNSYELTQELEGHENFVNSMCFHQKNGTLLTADSAGVIIQWSLRKNRKKSRNYWAITKKIKIREIEGVPINTIVLHPLGSRLLVHSRDNGLRLLDLATGIVLKKYEGLRNSRIQVCGKISPCGGLLLCGGEDGTLKIWDVDSAGLVAEYQTQPQNSPVACVDYHPYDHALVYSTFGAPAAAVVLRFDKNSSGEDVGLKLMAQRNLEDTGTSIISSKLSRRRCKDTCNSTSQNYTKIQSKYSESSQLSYDSRQDFRKKLKIFNDNEEQLKNKSANRLSNIIAKIDKILLNNPSKSQYDIEANNFQGSMETGAKMSMLPYVPPLFTNFEDNSSGSKSTEVLEMINFRRKYGNYGKSKSAREFSFSRSPEKFDKAFSDGAIKNNGNGGKLGKKGFEKSQGSYCPGNDKHEERGASSEESRGTYVIEIDDNNYEKVVESDSSVKSHVTFVVEHEKLEMPVPKPRGRRNL